MNPALQNPNLTSRVSRLKKRFLDVLSGSVNLDPRGATLFLEGLCAQDDPVVCLDAIIKSTHGLSAVQSAMQFDLSAQFTNGLGSTVLEYLLRASDVGGDALDTLLFHVVEPPIFWATFVRTFQQGELTEDAQLVFAKVLSRLLTLQNWDTTPYQDLAARPFIEGALAASNRHEIRNIWHLIKYILSNNGSVSICDVLNGPGGRHDNDSSDYHDIAILPTADEILCRKPPFLRTSFDNEGSASEMVYLDNTFRLLREDMLFDIREGVQALSQKQGKHRSLRVIGSVSAIGVYTGTSDRKTRWGVKLQCSTDFGKLRKMEDEGARVNFLTRDPHGSKILRHQSLVCLASGEDIISFGTVNRVESLLASKPPVVVIQLDGAINARRTLTSLCTTQDLRLIQLNATTFSFEHVLTALQKMDSVPLAKDILFWNSETPIASPPSTTDLSHVANAVTSNLSIDLKSLLDLPTSICLDKSQAKSLIAGLTKCVSLIQGPPGDNYRLGLEDDLTVLAGTGKSFIGTILVKAIHDKTSQTILIVCYTNHALDQFLEDLLKYNIPDKSIVRLGGRANSSIEHLSLYRQPRGRFPYDWDEINKLKRAAESHEDELEIGFDTLLDLDDDKNLTTHLKLQHPDFFEAFRVPLETEDGMTRVGQNGKAIDEGYLFSRWTRGLDAGVLSDDPHVQASARIWGMDHSARQQLLAAWRHEHVIKATESICQAGLEYDQAQVAIKQKFDEATVAVLREKRIIACTTTGAAIYAEQIKKAGPKVLLVEEAGEILESHVLTALPRNADRMILIGDHKQLRPKVNNYRLTVENGEGYQLNRSLFERLVLEGYPHETLSTQHRMRPEISAFVRELTYPELIDAPSTRGRPDVRGMLSNVIFVDHDHPEDDDALVGDCADGGAQTSKRNTYEVQMVLKIVRYLAQQGYKSENIVVLTPYLGQLYQLRDALKRDNDPILNELDSSDLARAGISHSAPSELKAKRGQIHLATIDNYQGEESDIVVASLTRSNKSNAIGFMDSQERLNVLLSRARDGLVLIGNSQTFLNSKKGGPLWRRFFTLIEKGQYAYQGYPVKCERHPERVVLLKRPSDFDALCPDGGCKKRCGFKLACGHVCPRKCHPRPSSATLDPHDVSQCRENMSAMCLAGHHSISWQCSFGQPSNCSGCTEEAERLEKIAQEVLKLQEKREEAEAKHQLRMAGLEAKLQAEEATEGGCKFQEEQGKQEEELRKQEEEHERRYEEMKEQGEKQRKQEEKKRKREERKRQRAEHKREQEHQELQEATRQREEHGGQEEAIRAREEMTRQLQEATHSRQEEREQRKEDKRKREELTNRLREATQKKQEEEHRRREEEVRNREEQTKRLQEATHRRLEVERLKQEDKRKREEQTQWLREATRKRWEEEEHRRLEEEIKQREEQTKRLQEATDRRRKEKEQRIQEQQIRSREEQTRRLLEATRQRQKGRYERPAVRLDNVDIYESAKDVKLEEPTQQALEQRQEQEARLRAEEERKPQEERRKQGEELGKQVVAETRGEEEKRKREEKKRKQQEKKKRRQEKKRRRQEKKARRKEKGKKQEKKGKPAVAGVKADRQSVSIPAWFFAHDQ